MYLCMYVVLCTYKDNLCAMVSHKKYGGAGDRRDYIVLSF